MYLACAKLGGVHFNLFCQPVHHDDAAKLEWDTSLHVVFMLRGASIHARHS